MKRVLDRVKIYVVLKRIVFLSQLGLSFGLLGYISVEGI